MRTPHVAIVNQNEALDTDLRPRREAETLAAAGYDVTLIGGCNSAAKVRELLDSQVRLELYGQPRAGTGVSGQIREQGQTMALAVAAVIRVSRRRPIAALHVGNPPDNFFFVGRIVRPLQGFTPRFVYDQHDTAPLVLAEKFPDSPLGKPLLTTARAIERRSFAAASLVVFASAAYRARAEREALLRSDSAVVLNGFPLPLAAPDDRWRLGAEHLLAYVGTIGEQDNVDHFVDAIAVLQARGSLRVVVAGDGSALEAAKERARSLGVASTFEWLGFVEDRTRIASLIRTADVCVAPEIDSEFNRHTTFSKVMEYMAAGAAVAAHRLPQTEALAGETISYAPDMTARGLCAAIEGLLDAGERRRSLGAAARERFEEQIAWDRSGGPRLVAAYDRMFESHDGP
jgi:glycosyltransferase involved in cell wall biosynthesis